MKFTVSREKLLKALQKVISTVGSKSTLPVLGNVLLEAENGTLQLTTTDLEIRITTQVEAAIESEGKTTVPAKKFVALVSKFTDAEVAFTCDERHHSEVVCGTSKFKLLGLSAEDFPLPSEFTPIRTVIFKESDLRKMFNQITYAVSLDDSRKVLHGVLTSCKDNTVTMVATDGKRLALVERVPEETSGTDGDAIIPLRAANEVKRLLDGADTVKLLFGEKQAAFESGEMRLTTKLIEGNYPNYRQVIPTSFSKFVDVETGMLLQKIELVSQVLSDNSSYIILSFDDNKIALRASSTDIGEGQAFVDIEYADAKVDVSFNPGFLADPLRNCDADKIKVKINDGFSPVALEGGEGFLYVIMPMRNK
ncbi:DNA polymerase III subunit beta [Victivallis sp. Marseille-Q1083]|uniref:DNA polymerase III subunit beta n=1 Tax=Victivallis sp. Marseille-Q1083 TaxID=2717288 RepID=UPI00158A10B9|nr:DNA polymerase III subunit beta [Victivallis sp. Marseille-Q1083]